MNLWGQILLTGSRTCTDYNLVSRQLIIAISDLIELGYKKIVMIHGGAVGADTLGIEFVNKIQASMLARGVDISHDPHYPEYSKYPNRVAPIMRNHEMVNMLNEDAIIVAIWENNSRGTKDTIEYAQNKGFEPRIFKD